MALVENFTLYRKSVFPLNTIYGGSFVPSAMQHNMTGMVLIVGAVLISMVSAH